MVNFERPGGRPAAGRAISTAVDVALALVIVGAAAAVLATAGGGEPVDADRADRAAESLAGTTVTVTYDLRAEDGDGRVATDDPVYELPAGMEPAETGAHHRITTYGPATHVLGEAALANLRIGGERPFVYGHELERSAEAAVLGRLVGSGERPYVVASWRPYEGASLGGTATAGEHPPRTADVSSATTTIDSGVPPVDAGTLAERFIEGEERTTDRSGIEDGFDAVGEEIAAATVEGYFAPEPTQYALESTLTERAVVVYDYRRLADAADAALDGHVTGSTPDAVEANAALVGDAGDDAGLAAVVAGDLRTGETGEEIRETYESFGDGPLPPDAEAERRAALEAAFEELVSTETIDVTVQTWEP